MKIQEAIEKAIEGGWEYELPLFWRRKNLAAKKGYEDFPITSIFDDPEFWKCLGKAMGWKTKGQGKPGLNRLHPDGRYHQNEWFLRWHRLIDHLAEGGTITSYFETL